MVNPDINYIVELAKGTSDENYAGVVVEHHFSEHLMRLKQIGYENQGTVLDVGCGFGQWTAALAQTNKYAIGVDPYLPRLEIGRKFCDRFAIENQEFRQGDIYNLPVEDNSVDAIFCYGVWMLTDRRRALQEFQRSLKPQGKLYICTNAFGWWLELASKNLLKPGKLAIAKTSLRACLWGGSATYAPNWSTEEKARNLLSESSISLDAFNHEGHINFYDDTPRPFYHEKFGPWNRVVELLATYKP